jgi:hypothetical protein
MNRLWRNNKNSTDGYFDNSGVVHISPVLIITIILIKSNK